MRASDVCCKRKPFPAPLLARLRGSKVYASELTKIHLCGVEGGLAFGRGASCHSFNEVDLELGKLRPFGLDHFQCALDRVEAAGEAVWEVVIAAHGEGCA